MESSPLRRFLRARRHRAPLRFRPRKRSGRGAWERHPWSLLLALACLSLVAGCTAEEATSLRGPDEQAALAEIEREFANARRDEATGLALLARGQRALGSASLDAARMRLEEAARRCAELPACPETLPFPQEDVAAAKIAERDAAYKAENEVPAREGPRPIEGPSAGVAPLLVSNESESRAGGAGSWDEASLLAEIHAPNEHVLAAINEWLTWRRDELAESRRHYSALRALMAPVYEEAGLPEALLFGQLATESSGKVHAYSRSGAVGPLQFMSATALRYGLRTVDGFDLRLDPEAATRANVAYVTRHLELFEGDLTLVMAAYNKGETRLRRLSRRFPEASFWDDEIFYRLPRETRRHVPRVFAAAQLFLDPERYGLAPDPGTTKSVSLTLAEPTALGEVAVCLGDLEHPEGWFRTLRNMNPAADPSERLPAGATIELPAGVVGAYARACGEDTPLRALARRLHDAEYPEKPPIETYVVRRGDTLAQIAERSRCVSMRRLARLNQVRPPDYVIHPGQRLSLPRCP